MGVFVYDKIKPHLDSGYQTVVETGTCLGYSTQTLANHFRSVHTIEINQKLHKLAVAKFKQSPGVTCHLGDSKKVLKELIPELAGKVVFFLDAHWSGDKTTDWEASYFKGYGVETSYAGDNPTPENQVPLLEEIKTIVETFHAECVIYVDDTDKFGDDGNGLKDKGFIGEDWTHLSLKAIKNVILDRMVEFKLDREQLVIKLSPAY